MPSDQRTSARRFSRVNGWSYPLNCLQIGAWVLTTVIAVLSLGLIVPSFMLTEVKAVLYMTLTPCLVATIVLQIVLTGTDPADDLVIKTVRSVPRPKFDRDRGAHVIDSDYYCHICQAQVDSSSKHCRQCNKCIIDFDHHCKWLNNCIGRKNYRTFMAYVVAIVVTSAFLLCACISLIVLYAKDQIREINPHFILGIHASNDAWMTSVCLTTATAFITAFFSFHLCVFHLRLIHQGLTTYGYIMMERERCQSQTEDTTSRLKRFLKCQGSNAKDGVKPTTQKQSGSNSVGIAMNRSQPLHLFAVSSANGVLIPASGVYIGMPRPEPFTISGSRSKQNVPSDYASREMFNWEKLPRLPAQNPFMYAPAPGFGLVEVSPVHMSRPSKPHLLTPISRSTTPVSDTINHSPSQPQLSPLQPSPDSTRSKSVIL